MAPPWPTSRYGPKEDESVLPSYPCNVDYESNPRVLSPSSCVSSAYPTVVSAAYSAAKFYATRYSVSGTDSSDAASTSWIFRSNCCVSPAYASRGSRGLYEPLVLKTRAVSQTNP